MAEQIFVVMTVSRQVQGEYVFLRAEGAFRKASEADALVKKLAQESVDAEGKAKQIKITSPNGEVICWREVGTFQLELQ